MFVTDCVGGRQHTLCRGHHPCPVRVIRGPPYQVRRSSDTTIRDIGVLSAGGYADAAVQDSSCAGTSCVITVVYDQSGRGDHLTQASGGTVAPGRDKLPDATAARKVSPCPLTFALRHRAVGPGGSSSTIRAAGRLPGDVLGPQLDSGHRSASVIVDAPLDEDIDLVTKRAVAVVSLDVEPV